MNTSNRECEIKYPLTKNNRESFEDTLRRLGFAITDDRIETDFILDDPNNNCKRNGILFRVRNISRQDSSCILITLKIKNKSSKFQDNLEIETLSTCFGVQEADKISNTVKHYTNIILTSAQMNTSDITYLLKYLITSGLCKIEIMQKHRVEYTRSNVSCIISFDELPNPIGQFMEIETHSEDDLYYYINAFSLDELSIEQRNYGKISSERWNKEKGYYIFGNDSAYYDASVSQLVNFARNCV